MKPLVPPESLKFLGCWQNEKPSTRPKTSGPHHTNQPEVVFEFLEFTQKWEKGKSQKYMVSRTQVRGNLCVRQATESQGQKMGERRFAETLEARFKPFRIIRLGANSYVQPPFR